MKKRLEHGIKEEGMKSNEQIKYLNLFLSTRAKQKTPKVKTQNVLIPIIADLCRLKFINLGQRSSYIYLNKRQ